jgi:uncharacterized repeat protein (TIGR03803 family)
MTRLSLIRSVRFLGLAVLASLPAGSAHAITILHSFAGYPVEGETPFGAPTLDGSTLFGMTTSGGTNGAGTIFRINTDGSGYQVLHSFGGSGDGATPFSSLTLDGSTLYGTTHSGGANGFGTIFRINTDGSGYQLLHSFAGPPGDGRDVFSPLTLYGSTLYGVTYWGGAYNIGTVYRINTNGTGFQVLHSFAGGNGDGGGPTGGLTVIGGSLFGTTTEGGPNDAGVIFRMNNDGSGFTLLHAFNGTDGEYPGGSLTLYGSTLYGMTSSGGANNAGTIFRINTDGTGFAVLHDFGSSGDGDGPDLGSLTLDGTTLYGMTLGGGVNGGGTIFSIDVNGSGYQVLHSFAGSPGDGEYPHSSVVFDGTTLYGMTESGGANDLGTVFSFVVPEPSTLALLAVGGGVLAMRPRRAPGEPAR